MGSEKKWILKDPADPEKVGRLATELGIDRVLAELLVARGVNTFEEARSFFRPSLADLHDPFLMKDMDKAVERLHTAISGGEKILVYGDYDVDGTTAVSLVYSYVKRFTSRVDFYMERASKDGSIEKYLMEVKGCTLEFDGIGYFPDAPTDRGVKHIRELIKAKKDGYNSAIAFVIQMDGVSEVRPYREMHPEFGEAMDDAKKAGVEIIFFLCQVEKDSLEIVNEVNSN